ncbi:MAG: Ig-like domain-containing domain, partial [Cyclobacteriaceae bacterium]
MRLFAALFVLIVFARCANQTSPNGGPQDKKPPALISSNPKSNQRNFSGEKIELTFDEYIKLKDPSEEIMISPTVGKETKFQVKKNKLVIVPKQKLAENTTYNISFRDAVQDINEGNPVFNLRLAFSTGDEIDSLSVSGNVYQLFKEEPPEKITVALYQADTFNIFNHQPIYFTRTDKKGNFTITNLKAGLYRIYAFDDKSKNLKVESKSERFGFLTKQFNPADKVDTLKIPLMQVDARPIKITSIRNTTRTSSVRLNKAIDSVRVESEYQNYFIKYFGDQQNEIVFYGILEEQPLEDSLKINL